MKKMIMAALVAALFWTFGYGGGPAGKWQGTISESGRDTPVELELRVTGNRVEGSLAILGETGAEIEKGTTLPIVEGKRDGDSLFFIVPVTGRIDNDALVFDLRLRGDKLEGTAHEMRQGSPLITMRFTRKIEGAAPPLPAPASPARRFAISRDIDLFLRVPDAWKDDLSKPSGENPPTITFTPAVGTSFMIMVTIGGVTKYGTPIRDENDLRQRVETMARSVEKQLGGKPLEIKRLSGQESHGLYFSAAGGATRPGEYKYLTRGIAVIGQVILAFNILTNEGQEAAAEAALAMLRGARLQPPPDKAGAAGATLPPPPGPQPAAGVTGELEGCWSFHVKGWRDYMGPSWQRDHAARAREEQGQVLVVRFTGKGNDYKGKIAVPPGAIPPPTAFDTRGGRSHLFQKKVLLFTLKKIGENHYRGVHGLVKDRDELGQWWRTCDIVVFGAAAKFISPSNDKSPQLLEFKDPAGDLMLSYREDEIKR